MYVEKKHYQKILNNSIFFQEVSNLSLFFIESIRSVWEPGIRFTWIFVEKLFLNFRVFSKNALNETAEKTFSTGARDGTPSKFAIILKIFQFSYLTNFQKLESEIFTKISKYVKNRFHKISSLHMIIWLHKSRNIEKSRKRSKLKFIFLISRKKYWCPDDRDPG
jgi:hypothetical protein